MTETKKENLGWVWAVAIGGVVLSLILACIAGAAAGFVAGKFSTRDVVQEVKPFATEIWPELRPSPTPPPVTIPEEELTPELISAALVKEVIADSPAEKAGLQPGDIIVAVNERQLTRDTSLADLISQHKPGDRITLTVWDRGKTRSVEIQLSKHPDDPARPYLGIYYSQLELPDVPALRGRRGNSD